MRALDFALAGLASISLCTGAVRAQQVRLAPDSVTLAAGRALHSQAIGAVTLTADRLILAEGVAAPIAKSTHWKRGALIGSLIGAALVYGFLFHDVPLPSTGAAIIASVGTGMIVGGIPGALIGAQFPKGDAP
jgi:hypothetical protein